MDSHTIVNDLLELAAASTDENARMLIRAVNLIQAQHVEISKLKAQATVDGWRLNPDRMGGQFTDEEINRDDW